MSIFFYFARTSLFRSKKHSFLSRISKNVSFWLFLVKKKMRKRSIFWQKPWTNPFAKFRFFRVFYNFTFQVQKAFFTIQNIKKMFLFGFFCWKKKIWEKGRFFDKNHGLTPLQSVHFFEFFRTSLFRSKKHSFLSRISKNACFWLF